VLQLFTATSFDQSVLLVHKYAQCPKHLQFKAFIYCNQKTERHLTTTFGNVKLNLTGGGNTPASVMMTGWMDGQTIIDIFSIIVHTCLIPLSFRVTYGFKRTNYR